MLRRILRLHPPPEPSPDPGFERIREQFETPPAVPRRRRCAAAEQAAARPVAAAGRADLRASSSSPSTRPEAVTSTRPCSSSVAAAATGCATRSPTWRPSLIAGGPIEAEAWRRGETVYCPDIRIPLYPTVLSEGAASLLPGRRPARGGVHRSTSTTTATQTAVQVERALVRSRHKLDYASLGGGPAALLREIGERRQALEIARGGVQLQVPEQTIVHDPADADAYRIELEQRVCRPRTGTRRSHCSPGWRPRPTSCCRTTSACCARWRASTSTG